MTTVHVLYIGRAARTLERLLAESDTSSPIIVTAVPTVEAAVEWLSTGQSDCLVWGLDCEDAPQLERLFSIAPGVPVVVPESTSPPECLERDAPSITRTRDSSLVEAVRSTAEPDDAPLDSPPEVILSLLDRSADRIARIDREGIYRSVSEKLADSLDRSSAELLEASVGTACPGDPETVVEHGRRAIETGTIQRDSDGTYRYVYVPIDGEQFQLVVQDPEPATNGQRVEPANEFIETVLDRLTDIFFVFDLSGRFLHWNDRLTEVTGYTDEEIQSMTPMEFFVKEDYERIDSAISEIVETGDATEIVRIRTHGGQLLPYEFTGSMVTHEDGAPRYVCGVARDVSRRRRSERVLREREQALANLIRNLPGVVYRYRNESGFPVEFMSEGCSSLTGYPRDHLESGELSWMNDVIHPEDRAGVKRDVREALEAGEQYQTTYRVETAGDGIRWIWEQGGGVDAPDGTVEYLDGYLTEITDIVEIEEELRREKAFTESALDAQPDLFYVFAPDGTILRWNDRYNEVTGYTDEEIQSMHPIDFIADEDVPQVLDTVEALTDDHESVSIEATLVSKDGTHIPYEFTGSVIEDIGEPTFDTHEADVYICGTGRDISQRVTAERERQEAITELERSNAELERFAYVASHDLKEPLRMIRSYLDLIQRRYESELDEDADEFITYAVDGAERMRQMIDDLLTYSRVGTDDITLQSVDCNAVLDRVIDALRLSIEETDADITVEPLPTIEADDQQLGQLFQNLVSNAIAYAGDSSPSVRISASDRGDEWRFSVSDSGVGIEPDMTDEVFEIFSSGSASSSTGIGLAICQKIIRRHDGEIWVESEPGVGSTFHFTVPSGKPIDAEGGLEPSDG
ncbi:PAS domain-containing sensor histidine kinase [Halalkalicoccus subterraneus]|uniref:PAS domain-containing sensor histidine kinase n=1 Tax=Halalkalicoccus subterraneus TaxID=2675002 RepID=UPI000EFA3542|nr:PAS domain S-box protein [Halalkalicoccus subterraneus]